MRGVSQTSSNSAPTGKIQRLPLVVIGIDTDRADPIVGFNLKLFRTNKIRKKK